MCYKVIVGITTLNLEPRCSAVFLDTTSTNSFIESVNDIDILVLGATGNAGSALVKKLKDIKANFGVLTTQVGNAEKLSLDKRQVRVGNFEDVDSLRDAMQGVSRIYLAMPFSPHTVSWTRNVISAAKASGVQHIVKQSRLNACSDATSAIIRDHATTDALITASGLDYTILQSNSFLQNLYDNLSTIKGGGRFYLPLRETACSRVDINDVAEVAAAVLTSDGHVGKVYKITGAEALTSAEQAKILSKASGQDISYVHVSEGHIKDALKSFGFDPWLSQNLAEMIAWSAENDSASVHDTIQTILGRAPLPFSDFAEEFAHAVNSGSHRQFKLTELSFGTNDKS